MRSQIMYAHRHYIQSDNRFIFWHIGPVPEYTKAHGPDKPIHLVRVSQAGKNELESNTYFGWINFIDDCLCFVYYHRSAFDMCFPYGPNSEEKAGKGRIVRLTVHDLGLLLE